MKHSLLIILVWLPLVAAAQTFTVKGSVKAVETGYPIADAHIVVEHTLIGTTTNLDGAFSLEIPVPSTQEDIVLSVSRLGYTPFKTSINPETKTLDIELYSTSVQLSEVVISAHKSNLTNKKRSTVPLLISNQNIIQSGIHNISEILIRQPGVALAGQAYHAAPSIRGLARKRVVVLLDGEKVSSERNVGPPGTFINPFEIETIEILKGPYATLYGSDAIGGVVNIISKSYQTPFYTDKVGGRLDLAYKSSNNGINGNLALNGKLKKLKYHIHAGYRDSDSYKVPGGERLMNTFAEEQHLGGKLVYDFNRNNQLTVKSWFSNGGPIGKPAYDTLTNAVHDYDNHYITGLNYKLSNINKTFSKIVLNATRHTHNLGAKIIKHKQEANPDDDKLINNRKILEGTDYILQMDTYITLSHRFKIVSGFDGYLRQDINISEEKIVHNYNTGIFIMNAATTLMQKGAQNSYGIFTQGDYILTDNLYLNAGVRWNYFKTSNPLEDTSKTESAWSGHMGLAYNPTEHFSIKTNIGSAFRIPDIKELYVTTRTPGGLNISNSDLVSERSLNIDLALVYKTGKSLLELSLFRNSINNMIVLDWDDGSGNRTGTFKNIGEGLLYGTELSLNRQFNDHFNAFVNLTKIYGKDVNADDELMDVPPLQLNAGTRYKLNDNISMSLSGRFSGKQDDVAEDDIPNDSFMVLDFSAQWQIRNNLNLNVSVTNILNETYREHHQFGWMNAPTRSFNTGLNFKF